jgi:hypothetical protein
MRRRLAILVSVTLVMFAVYALRERGKLGSGRGGGGDSERARIDRGAAGGGDRERIDPHGPASAEPLSSPLGVQAQVESRSAGELRVAVELTAGMEFDSVVVRASRYDVAGALEPGWSEVVWTGALQPGAAARFEARIPIGGAEPARVQVGARAIGPGGGRHTATAIVRSEAAKP